MFPILQFPSHGDSLLLCVMEKIVLKHFMYMHHLFAVSQER